MSESRIKFGFLCLIIFFIGFCSNGQYLDDLSKKDFTNITVEDGLSQNTVNCILKDRLGYLWFGTNSGLNLFDSRSIKVIDHETATGHRLSDLQILDLHEDSDGVIWIATDIGLIRYVIRNDNIEMVELPKSKDGSFSINCIEVHDDSTLWLGGNQGIYLFSKSKNKAIPHRLTEMLQQQTSSTTTVYSLCDTPQKLFIGTLKGLKVFDKEANTLKTDSLGETNLKNDERNAIQCIVKVEGNKIWMGTELDGMISIDGNSGVIKSYTVQNSSIPHNDIRNIVESSDGYLWIATNGGGVCKFNEDSETFEIFSHDPKNERSISNNSVYSIFEDDEDILWIGTYAGGVSYNSNRNKIFKSIRHQPYNSNSICESSVRSIYIDAKDDMWVGTLSGLSHYDHKNEKFTSYIANDADPSSLSFNTVTSICEDLSGKMWVGTYSGGLNLLDPRTGKFQRFRHNSKDVNSISSDNVYCVKKGNDGNIWIGTSNGLNVYLAKERKFKKVGDTNVRGITSTKDGNFFLAVVGGIAKFTVKNSVLEYFTHEDLSNFPVNAVYDDGKGYVWFGSQGGGFGYLNLKTHQVKIFSTDEGLPSKFVSGIIPYTDRYIWLSTFKGLSQFDLQTERFSNFDLTSGLPCLEYHPGSSTVLPDGNLAFGGSKGMVFFNPDEFPHHRSAVPIVLRTLKINNSEVSVNQKDSPLKENISYAKSLQLKNFQKDFSVDFVALDYKNSRVNQYAYILENYMDDWNNIGNQSSIGFTNLDPGKYKLRIKALVPDADAANSEEYSLDIELEPPFWQRWYFYVLVLTISVLVIYYYSKYTVISIEQRNKIALEKFTLQKHEEYNQLRLRFFTYISHELRTPLSLIVDPLKKLIKENQDEDKLTYLHLIEKNTSRLLKLVNQILDFKELENDTLRLQVSPLSAIDCVKDIFANFEKLADKNRIDYQLICEEKIPEVWLDADKVEKILHNLLFNAFKFTAVNGQIAVELGYDHGKKNMLLIVRDNGCGIEEKRVEQIFELYRKKIDENTIKHENVGIGLSYVKRLVELHKGVIEVDSKVGLGSSFKISIPAGKNAYDANEIAVIPKAETDNSETIETINDEAAENTQNHMHRLTKVGAKVVLVEDETDLRNYLSKELSKKFKVLVAENGREGLELIRKNNPDLILSDNVMPEMDGIELCNTVKADPKLSHIPFVFISAWTSNDFKMRGLKTGAQDYISKPFDTEILVAKMENIIRTHREVIEKSRSTIKVEPDDPNFENTDITFLKRAQAIIEENIDNSEFSTKDFESQLNMSHALIYRKLKKLTGKSSNEFMREYRLRRAKQFFDKDQNLTIAVVGFKVGFGDPKYFSQCFKAMFGLTPSQYLSDKSKTEQS